MIDDADFRILCEQHRMSMPNEIYLCETEDEILWCEDDTTDYGDGVRYIRADIHEALRAEVQALKQKALSQAYNIRFYADWMHRALEAEGKKEGMFYHAVNYNHAIEDIQQLEAELKEQADD